MEIFYTTCSWIAEHIIVSLGAILSLSAGIWALWRRYMLPNLYPVSFKILGEAQPIVKQTGISFKVRIKFLKRVDEVIDRLYAKVESQELKLIWWEGQPPKGKKYTEYAIFGEATIGNYADKTLEVIIDHDWQQGRFAIRHHCLISNIAERVGDT